MSPSEVSIVTVVFEPELSLLDLQARSMNRHVDAGSIDEVLVVDNTRRGMNRAARDALYGSFGDLAGSVSILRPDDLGTVPRGKGWEVQQALKLLAAGRVRSSHYLVLDAKNHFVKPLERDFLFNTEGRPRLSAYSFRTHPHRQRLEQVLAYLGVDPLPYVDHFTATVTPFLLDRDLVLGLIDSLSARSGRPFAEEFLASGLSEFFLYSGWVVAEGESLDQRFDLNRVACEVIWKGGTSDASVHATVERARASRAPVFSIHRVAVGLLSDTARSEVAQFWADSGLFPDAAEAQAYLSQLADEWRSARRRLFRTKVADRLRDAGRAITRIDRNPTGPR